jgi:hypothetical protein
VSQGLLSHLASHAVGLVLLAVGQGRLLIGTFLGVCVLGCGHTLSELLCG